MPDNKGKIYSFYDTGCIEGCWSGNNHEKLVNDATTSNLTNVKLGARFPDTTVEYYKSGLADNGKQLYIFQGMEFNPWWHGYYRRNIKGQYLCNYVAAYIYETRLANEMKTKTVAAIPNGLSDSIAKEIRNDIGLIDWKRHYNGGIPTNGTKRAFIWGMAIHNLADSFAHSTCYKGTTDRILHPEADKIDVGNKQRWNHAAKAVSAAVGQYMNSKQPSGTFNEFSIIKSASEYKMINIKNNISAVAGDTEGKKYNSVSVTKNANQG